MPYCGTAVIEALCGVAAPARYADPFIADVGPGGELQPHQIPYIDRAALNVAALEAACRGR